MSKVRKVQGESDMSILSGAMINLKDALTCLKKYVQTRESLMELSLRTEGQRESDEKKKKKKNKKTFIMRKELLEQHGYILKEKERGKHHIFKRRKKNGKKVLRKIGLLKSNGRIYMWDDGEFVRAKNTKEFLKKVVK